MAMGAVLLWVGAGWDAAEHPHLPEEPGILIQKSHHPKGEFVASRRLYIVGEHEGIVGHRDRFLDKLSGKPSACTNQNKIICT